MAKAKKKPASRGKRRGKGEDMTGAKEGAVEVRTPAGIGDNSQLAIPEPDDWKHHKKAIRGWQEKVTTAQSGLRNAKKAAIKAGVNMESMNLVTSIERQNDPAKAMQFFQQLDLGLSLSDETSLRITPHDSLAGDVADQAYKRGFADGEAPRTANNRYPEGSDLHAAYARGWRHGTAKNMGLPDDKWDETEDAPEKVAAE